MPDPVQFDVDEAALPAGIPSYLWFGGIVEGPRHDSSLDATLRAVTAGINQLSLGRADLEVDGGRFSILLNDETIPGGQAASEERQKFLGLLQDLQDAVADSGQLESTLRCTEVYEDKTVESLFAPVGQQFRSVSRVREISAEDRRHAPLQQAQVSELARLGRGKAGALLLFVVVLLGLLAWERGLIDQVFAESSSKIAVEMSGLEGVLVVEVGSSWGKYVIEFRRGPAFPIDMKQREALLAAMEDLAERALLLSVVDGGTIYARIEDENGKVLGARPVKLSLLLSDPDEKVVVRIPGMIRANQLRLAMDSGLRDR